jgi:penicillin-binding protein 2
MSEKNLKFIIYFFILASFVVLFVKLFELQIIKGAYYKNLADGNRIRRVVLKAPRGEILARGGELLVKNDKKEEAIFYDPNKGYYVSDDLSDESQKIAAVDGWQRYYPLKEAASHITGYIGAINEDELGKVSTDCPKKGERTLADVIGRSGLEEYYDCQLRGIDGEKLVEVAADGTYVRLLGEKPPVKGSDLKLTVDYPLQEYVSTLLPGIKGMILVTDSHGEVLALFSSPSYDPNIFLSDRDKVGGVLNDKSLPLFNRVISGKYSPGSIFKPIVATAALETGSIDENYHYQDTGSINFSTPYGDYSFNNWYFTQYGGAEGNIDVTKALARSTDTFFYKVGELTGIEGIVEWSRKFGLSEKTSVDLPGEVEGLVPDPQWKQETKGERWFLGNTYHFSIGQGDLSITPIGIHTALEAIANGGKLCTPHLNSEVQDDKACKSLDINSENIDLIKEGMKKACSQGGTAYTFFDFKDKTGIDVACKTGTAQVGTQDDTHAWFTAFAPIEEPEIVVTILIEKGGEGSKIAGPIARQIFDFWFKK